MEIEYEVRILEIDVEKIKKKLNSIGSNKCIERNMRRYVFSIDSNDRNKWIRLRDDGEKVTLTIKDIHSAKIDGTKEIEVVVGDFEKTKLILEKLGFKPRAYQENKRISYIVDGVCVEIDFWPKIPPYLEIEGKSVEDVKKVVEKLGFKMEDTTSMDVSMIFNTKYRVDVDNIKELKF